MPSLHLRHALLLATLIAGCSGTNTDGVTDPNQTQRQQAQTIGQVTVLPGTASLNVGQTTQFSAIAYDQKGSPMDAGTPIWTSNAPSIATVSSSGMVTANGSGAAVITATMSGHSGSGVVTVQSTAFNADIQNQLIYPVDVRVNGVFVATVAAQTTQHITVPGAAASATVDWSLDRPTLSGRPLGDAMGGTFSPTSGSTTHLYTINNLIGSEYYFAPVISNTTGSDLLMVVNYQLAAENRCNCVVGAGRSAVAFGYYHLYSNSVVAAFRNGSNYTGAYYYFSNFGNSIPVGSGRQDFTYTVAP